MCPLHLQSIRNEVNLIRHYEIFEVTHKTEYLRNPRSVLASTELHVEGRKRELEYRNET